VAAEEGLDLSGHSSTPVDQELLEWADLVLAMSAGHLAVIQASGAGERATLLGAMAAGEEEAGAMGVEVPDPFGQDDAIYRETYRVLERMIVRVLDRLEPIVAP
jgi:protein-tyrosine-phosphatase